MNCISNYFLYYYNYYRNTSKKKIDKPKLNSKIELDYTYDLVFSNINNSSKQLNIVLYEIYNNGININKTKSKIFLYDNKIYKIHIPKSLKNYLSVIHTIKNYNIHNVLIPYNIYYNKYKHEIVQIYKYYPDGDLFDYFYNNNLVHSEIHYIYKQIVNIVYNLHTQYIVHRDLKLENFLIYNNNSNIDIVLIDLDFTVINNNKNNTPFNGGTEQYVAYEIINNYTIKDWVSCDVWSLCIILYILLFREFPWQNSSKNNISFIQYINKYNESYWYNKLSILKINDTYKKIYSQIFNYGFNLNYTKRCDITYIKNLVEQL